jgi:hypothetical protein
VLKKSVAVSVLQVGEETPDIEGDEVATSFTQRSIHDRAEWLGLVPTDKEDRVLTILIQRIVGGKIAEERSESGNVPELTQERWETSDGGALLLCRGELGAGGRLHPPYAAMLRTLS